MNIDLVAVPYDSGHRAKRMGSGPLDLLEGGLTTALENAGHRVTVTCIESELPFRAEVQNAFHLYSKVSTHVRGGTAFPLILGGNCGNAIGLCSGSRATAALVWYDAHGDYMSPETTRSGFLDGMALAVQTGDCWRTMAADVPHFRPTAATNVIHVGGHDFDAGEAERMREHGITVLDARTIATDGLRPLTTALTRIAPAVDGVIIHVDLDVLDTSVCTANSYAREGGLSLAQTVETFDEIARHAPITGAVLAAYDPAAGDDDRARQAAMQLVLAIVAAAARTA
jgi:arginase